MSVTNTYESDQLPAALEPTALESDPQPVDAEAGPETEGADEADSTSPWSRFGDGPFPHLPKTAAVNRGYKAGRDFGLPENFASALANAVVDPAELRTALNNPTKVRVAGGVFDVIDVDLFTPGVVPLPTNNRTMDRRVYPAGGAANNLGPLSGPRSTPGTTSELWIDARSVEHALDEAKRGSDYILVKNPLKDSVAARGIIMPVTVVYFELRHKDGQPAMPLLGAADGSSRLAGAHAVLHLNDPRTTHYDMPTNRDTYRRFIDPIASPADEPRSALAERTLQARRNALVAPARVFLRFTPQRNSAHDYARAVASYVGMLHVDPPRPWTQTGKLEAMAESVLEILRSASVLDDTQHDYLGGFLTPEAAEQAGLPTRRDEQAAYVIATLLRSDLRKLVDRGIMDVTAKRSVSPSRRVDVVAELALRPTRSRAVTLNIGDAVRDRSDAMRAAYLRATHLSGYVTYPWRVTGRGTSELLDGALAELHRPDAEQANPSAWTSRLELAALAQYHLTAYGVLKREPMGDKNADQRGPHEILALMLGDEQGLHLLRQAIDDGRAEIPPRLVDNQGQLERDPSTDSTVLAGDWLRYTGFPSGAKDVRPASIDDGAPTTRAAGLQHAVLGLVAQLAARLDELDQIPGPSGGTLLEQRGWPKSDTADAFQALLDAQSRIAYWGQVANRQAHRPPQQDDVQHDDEQDDVTESADPEWEDE